MGKAVIVSWVTVDEPGSSEVRYWSENSDQKKIVEGKLVTYSSHHHQKFGGNSLFHYFGFMLFIVQIDARLESCERKEKGHFAL